MICFYSIFSAVTKRKTNRDNKQKLNCNLLEYSVEAVKPHFAPKIMFGGVFSNASIVIYDLSFMRHGKKLTRRENVLKITFVFFESNYFRIHESH